MTTRLPLSRIASFIEFAGNEFVTVHHSRSLKNRRIASIEATRIVSWPLSHLSTVERDTPSSREIRAFFHFDRSAKARKRAKTSAFSCSLRSWRRRAILIFFLPALETFLTPTSALWTKLF